MAHKPSYPRPDQKLPPRQGGKIDRYEQRSAKTIARRNITGGF